jgi:hypothetical protein
MSIPLEKEIVIPKNKREWNGMIIYNLFYFFFVIDTLKQKNRKARKTRWKDACCL